MFDIPVALIFFIRPDTLREVFKKVANAKPRKLFLIQDGPRTNADIPKILECREIVSNIDWECEVYTNYSTVNLGCGQRPATGISWVFENVDKAIILEDDCVPADSFFGYCQAMLDKYEFDNRVGIISGLNHFEEYDFGGYSYGFSRAAGIWGWATWKDRWDKYNYRLEMIDDDYIVENILQDIRPKYVAKRRIKEWKIAREKILNNDKITFWDHQWSFIRNINSWVSIVPKYNQISNIGAGADSTHAQINIKKMPKRISRFFYMRTKELEFPLKMPDFMIVNREYDDRYFRLTYPGFFTRVKEKLIREKDEIINKIIRK